MRAHFVDEPVVLASHAAYDGINKPSCKRRQGHLRNTPLRLRLCATTFTCSAKTECHRSPPEPTRSTCAVMVFAKPKRGFSNNRPFLRRLRGHVSDSFVPHTVAPPKPKPALLTVAKPTTTMRSWLGADRERTCQLPRFAGRAGHPAFTTLRQRTRGTQASRFRLGTNWLTEEFDKHAKGAELKEAYEHTTITKLGIQVRGESLTSPKVRAVCAFD